MGTKYSSQSSSGYNASPPSDDGTAVSTNEVKWSFIKTKLADVLKTFIESVNTALVTHFDESVLDNTGALTTTAAHHKRTINQTNSGTISLGDAGTMAVGYIVTVKNSHTAANTVDLATGADTLDGTAAGSVSLASGQSMTFVTNAAADGYYKSNDAFGNLVIAQVVFPATASPSADANTLDDYQEGEYGPTLTPSSSGTITLATTHDTLAYTKIGQLVHVQGQLEVDTLGSPLGNKVNMDLPFGVAPLTDAADASVPVLLARGLSGAALPASPVFYGYVNQATDEMELTMGSMANTSTSNLSSMLSTSTAFMFDFTYTSDE